MEMAVGFVNPGATLTVGVSMALMVCEQIPHPRDGRPDAFRNWCTKLFSPAWGLANLSGKSPPGAHGVAHRPILESGVREGLSP